MERHARGERRGGGRRELCVLCALRCSARVLCWGRGRALQLTWAAWHCWVGRPLSTRRTYRTAAMSGRERDHAVSEEAGMAWREVLDLSSEESDEHERSVRKAPPQKRLRTQPHSHGFSARSTSPSESSLLGDSKKAAGSGCAPGPSQPDWREEFERDGFVLLRGVVPSSECCRKFLRR